MAVGKSKKPVEAPIVMPVEEKKRRIPWRKIVWVAVIMGGLVLWWKRTNTWPVLAVVNGRPVWRMEVEKTLFSQSKQPAPNKNLERFLLLPSLKQIKNKALRM